MSDLGFYVTLAVLSSEIVAVAVFRKLHQLPELPSRSRLLYPNLMSKRPKQDMVQLGAMGGQATLKKKGARFFASISKRRKKFRGGRPRKDGSKPPEKAEK